MIEPKRGQCIDCQVNSDYREKPLIAGRCQMHYRIFRASVSKERYKNRRKPKDQKKSYLQQVTGLYNWYQEGMNTREPICENCGKEINKNNQKEWHGSQAHILPKSPNSGFPSVATHPMNRLILGYYCCHGQFDSSWLNASEMPVFELAKLKFEMFKDEIGDEEKRRIPEVFLVKK